MKKLITTTLLSLLFLGILNAQLVFSMNVTNVTSTNYTLECWVHSTNTTTQIDNCSFGVSFSNSNITGVSSISLGANYSTLYTIANPTVPVINISSILSSALSTTSTAPELLWTIVYAHNGSSSYVSDITLTKNGTWSPGSITSNLDVNPVVISSQALPIVLTSFTVNGNEINWETSTEYKNKIFVIETSTDGQGWNHLYQCEGAGTSYNIAKYSYTDPNVYTETIYYRLKQIDYNDNFSYSGIAFGYHQGLKQTIEYFDLNRSLYGTNTPVLIPEYNVVYIKMVNGKYDSKIEKIK